MKKLSILVILVLSVLVSSAQFFPKKCIVIKADTVKSDTAVFKSLYRTAPIFDLSVKKASISAVTLPVSLSEAFVENSQLNIVNSLTIGGAYLFGGANVQVLQDSTVFVSGITYAGITAAYGAANVLTVPKGSFVIGLIFGYEQFALAPGYDFLNNKPVICLTYNLVGLPFLNSLANITIKK